MKKQTGQVQYKDRNDYFVTYGITDDGKQYYFIDKDVSQLKNGNRVATTVLVEAIDDMVKASNVGVIDDNGVVIIPFDNRRIKPITDDVLLVEVSKPSDQSVLDAIASKNDPQAATTLVSTTTTVKDKISSKMSGEGRFIFNDLFSEATVYDIDGNNLVNGEHYSFIGFDKGKLLLCKNVPEAEVVEYDIEKKNEVVNTGEVTPAVDTSVDIPAESVQEPIQEENVEIESNIVDNPSIPVAEAEEGFEKPEEVPILPETNQEVATEEDNTLVEDVPTVDEQEPETIPEDKEEISVEEETPSEPVVEEKEEEPLDLNIPMDEEVSEIVPEEKEEPISSGLELNIGKAEETEEIEDPFKNSVFKADKIELGDPINDNNNEFKDPDIADGTELFRRLIDQNKKFKEEIKGLREKNEISEGKITTLTEINDMQKQKIDAYDDRNRRDRDNILRFQNLCAEQQKKIAHLERLSEAQNSEIDILREQLEGKNEMIKYFGEARTLLDENNPLDYEIEDYYRKVA